VGKPLLNLQRPLPAGKLPVFAAFSLLWCLLGPKLRVLWEMKRPRPTPLVLEQAGAETRSGLGTDSGPLRRYRPERTPSPHQSASNSLTLARVLRGFELAQGEQTGSGGSARAGGLTIRIFPNSGAAIPPSRVPFRSDRLGSRLKLPVVGTS
jgi:hypothetical protein